MKSHLIRSALFAGIFARVLAADPEAAAAGGAPAETPAKAPTKAEQKAADKKIKDEAKAKEKADKEAAAKAKAEAKTVKDEQNGVTRPASGKTKTVWDVADEMSKAAKAPVSRKDLTEKLLAAPYNLVIGTIHTQYGKWRKYHGLSAEKAAKPAEAPAADAAKTE